MWKNKWWLYLVHFLNLSFVIVIYSWLLKFFPPLGRELVKVIFIDHGSVREMLLSDLRPLPLSAYETPAQAIHCYLYGVIIFKIIFITYTVTLFTVIKVHKVSMHYKCAFHMHISVIYFYGTFGIRIFMFEVNKKCNSLLWRNLGLKWI